MQKWLRSIDWLAINTSALVLVLGLWSIQVCIEAAQQPAHTQTQNGSCAVTPEDQARETFWVRATCDPVSFFTLLLAIFSGLLTIVSFIQIRFLIRADATGRITAEAARDNAKAALDAVSVSSESQRAHIWMERIDFKVTRDASRVVTGHKIDYKLINSGQTPGIVRRVVMNCFRGPSNEWLPVPNYEGASINQVGLVAPARGHQAHDQSFLYPVADLISDLPEFAAETRRLILYGYIEYIDIFDQSAEHRSGFAYRIPFDTAGNVTGDPSFQGPESYWHYS